MAFFLYHAGDAHHLGFLHVVDAVEEHHITRFERYIGGFISENGLFTFHGDIIPLVVMVVSALVMGIFVFLSEKKKLGWVDSFSIAGSMIAGMTAAVIVGLI